MSSSDHAAIATQHTTLREIFTVQTSINLLSYTFLALHAVAYDQVLPVFLNYPRVIPDETNTQLPFRFTGGFGLGSDKIGTIYTVYGIACGVVQFLLFPPLCNRFGVLNCYRFASMPPTPIFSSLRFPLIQTTAMVFPFVYFVTPYTALIQDTTTRFAVFLTLMLIKGFVVIIGFPCTTILLTNSASSLRILGTLNGFATTFSGMGRAIGPACVGAVFSWGVKNGYAIAPWWFLSLIALVGTIPPWFIVEGGGPTRSQDTDDDDDAEEESLLPNADDSSDDEDQDVALIEAVDELDSDSDTGRSSTKDKRSYGTLNCASR